jgi:hypothetical protein
LRFVDGRGERTQTSAPLAEHYYIDDRQQEAKRREEIQEARPFAESQELEGGEVAEPGQHRRRRARAPARHYPENIEGHQRIDSRYDRDEQKVRLQPGQRYGEETRDRAGAVQHGGAAQTVRHRLQARQQHERRQRRLAPDLCEGHEIEGAKAVAKPRQREPA